MSAARQQLLDMLTAERDQQIALLQAFVRTDTCNPPGDTRQGAGLLGGFLDRHGLPHRVVAPQPEMPNIIGHVDGHGPGRHLVLNGHIDVFPIGNRDSWSRDPLGAEIAAGRLYGRGAVDMKCGTVASLFTYAYLARVRDAWPGRLTLTVVSDEETGGRWGADYLLENLGEEVLGDCVLNGEPSSRHTVRFGEKSILWLRFRIKVPGGHSAYPHLSPSANKIAARLILDLERLERLEPEMPAGVRAVLERPDVRRSMDEGLGAGAADVAMRLSLNIGTLNGGVKTNMLPEDCVFEADCRLPIGLTRARVMAEVAQILQGYPEATVEEVLERTVEPAASDPDADMVRIIQANAAAACGVTPLPIVNLGATDCRFWRNKGVPAYVYGCSPEGMGAPDESVEVEEFLNVVRVHVLSAFDYLAARDPDRL